MRCIARAMLPHPFCRCVYELARFKLSVVRLGLRMPAYKICPSAETSQRIKGSREGEVQRAVSLPCRKCLS